MGHITQSSSAGSISISLTSIVIIGQSQKVNMRTLLNELISNNQKRCCIKNILIKLFLVLLDPFKQNDS